MAAISLFHSSKLEFINQYPPCEVHLSHSCRLFYSWFSFYSSLFVDRLIRRDIAIEDNRIKLRRRFWQMKLVRLTAIAITAFMLSWSPYSLASLISIFRGNSVLSAGEAEVPALMAKASVIYNPIVYTVMNRRFRRTLWNIILCITCKLLLLLCPEINRIKASKHRVTRTVTVTSPTQLSNFGEFLSSWRQNSS